MKKVIVTTVFLLLALSVFKMFDRNPSPLAAPQNSDPEVLGDSMNVPQQFSDAGKKVGYHVYYPTQLPAGFAVQQIMVYPNNQVEYSITNADSSRRFIVAEGYGQATATANSLLLSKSDLEAMQWTVSNVTLGDLSATFGQASQKNGDPVNHEDLIYDTNDGVHVDIFDNFGYGKQIAQLAQSMQ